MDLPTCPACNQSVLDDDAETCPFCGASMSGKPTPGGAPKSAAKASKPTTTPAAEKKSSQDEQGDGDSVIESDGAAAKAIPVRRKRVKGLVLRVRCPMCETEGWVPAKAAGRSVRCANKKCLVPVFQAPALPKKAEPEPEEKASFGVSWPIVGIVAVALVIAGVGVATEGRFFLVPKIEPPPKGGWTSLPTGENGGETDPDEPGGGEQPVPPVPATKTVAEIRSEILQSMVQLSGNTPVPLKPRARGVVVSAHARAGDLEGALAELGRLQGMSNVANIDLVDPLVEIAWAEFAGGETESADRRAERARAFVEENRLPGRTVGQAIGNLAAYLVVRDRGADAEAIMARDPNRSVDGALALAEIRARATRSFDVDVEFRLGTLLPSPSRSAMMVVAQLVDHGRLDEAVRFASGRSDADEKIECLVLVADLSATRRSANATRTLDKVLAVLAEPDRATAEARVAARRSLAGLDDTIPESLVNRATGAAGKVAALPEPRAVLDRSHGFTVRRPSATLAAAALGRALAVRDGEGDKAAAWQAYEAALAHAASHAPPLEVIASQSAVAERGPVEGIAANRMTDYRSRLGDLEKIARVGFEIKIAVLLDAATNGLADEAWAHVSAETFEESLSAVLATPLGLVLRGNGSEATKEAVAAALAEADTQPSLRAASIVEPALLLEGDPSPVTLAKTLSEGRGAEADTVAVRLACRLRRGARGRERSAQFVKALASRFVSAEAAKLVEAASAKGLPADRAWIELEQNGDFTDLVAVAAREGLLLAVEANAEEPAPTVASGEK